MIGRHWTQEMKMKETLSLTSPYERFVCVDVSERTLGAM